jgi:hypothetical protein
MECIFLSITPISSSNASFVHIPFLILGGTEFNCGVNLLFCGSKVGASLEIVIIEYTNL